jgi:VanZ family protein
MFEPVKYFSHRPEWVSSLSRLNRTLFLMVIDSVSRFVSHSPGKPTFNTPSDFIGPDQKLIIDHQDPFIK